MISQVMTKESLESFTEDEIFPIKKITYTDKEECGGYGPISISMKNGENKVIDYKIIERNMRL